jgi:chromosome segregation ATPase
MKILNVLVAVLAVSFLVGCDGGNTSKAIKDAEKELAKLKVDLESAIDEAGDASDQAAAKKAKWDASSGAYTGALDKVAKAKQAVAAGEAKVAKLKDEFKRQQEAREKKRAELAARRAARE